MMIFSKNRILNHVFFWLGIFVFYSLSVADRDLFQQFFETTLLRLPLLMAAAYLLNYWQVPHYFQQKKYWLFGFSLLITTVILTLIYRVIGVLYLDRYCAQDLPYLVLADFPYHMLSFHFPALIMYFYMSNTQHYQEKLRLDELHKQKVTTELKYLKAQLNPHFLFNTLNNLYSFVINNSPKAGDMVLQISEILDYTLYKSQNSKVPLLEELKTIENYIALQETRFGNKLVIEFHQELQQQAAAICPLLLLSIVENAFKHGATPSILAAKIIISVKQTDSSIIFKVWNSKVAQAPNADDAHVSEQQLEKKGDEAERIGLMNVKRQLNLIYPDKHQLYIDNTEHYFNLELTLVIS